MVGGGRSLLPEILGQPTPVGGTDRGRAGPCTDSSPKPKVSVCTSLIYVTVIPCLLWIDAIYSNVVRVDVW